MGPSKTTRSQADKSAASYKVPQAMWSAQAMGSSQPRASAKAMGKAHAMSSAHSAAPDSWDRRGSGAYDGVAEGRSAGASHGFGEADGIAASHGFVAAHRSSTTPPPGLIPPTAPRM